MIERQILEQANRKGKLIMEPFKICPNCGRVWETREDFIADTEVQLVGYQAHFEKLQTGLFLFNHSCHTTMALEVSVFRDLYDGPVFQEKKTGGQTCPGFCLHSNNFDICPAQCECAYVREIIQILV